MICTTVVSQLVLRYETHPPYSIWDTQSKIRSEGLGGTNEIWIDRPRNRWFLRRWFLCACTRTTSTTTSANSAITRRSSELGRSEKLWCWRQAVYKVFGWEPGKHADLRMVFAAVGTFCSFIEPRREGESCLYENANTGEVKGVTILLGLHKNCANYPFLLESLPASCFPILDICPAAWHDLRIFLYAKILQTHILYISTKRINTTFHKLWHGLHFQYRPQMHTWTLLCWILHFLFCYV